MINKTFICSYNKNGICTHPNASTPSTGPDGLFAISDGGCRAKNCSGYLSPVHSKVAYPVTKIEIAHTPYTVPSIGPSVSYYVFTGSRPTWSESEKRFPLSGGRAVVGLLSEWYEKEYYPPMLSLNRTLGEKWGCKISGYFQAQANGTHAFYFAGDGYVGLSVKEIGGNPIAGHESEVVYTDGRFAIKNVPGLVAGQWYQFDFSYYQLRIPVGGYTVLVSYPGHSGLLPVGAGMLSGSDYETVSTWHQLKSISNISYTESEGQASTLKFSIPLSSGEDGLGYRYNTSNNRFELVSDTSTYLKKHELIRMSIGYNTNDHQDYIVRFVGHITDIGHEVGDNKRTLEVACSDFTYLLNEAESRNYPTRQTYWLAGMTDVDASINGYVLGTPAFDAWRIVDVVRALMIHAGIDSTLFDEKYEFIDRAGAQIIGSEYLVSPVDGTNKFPAVKLDRAVQYGNPESELNGGEPDSTYFFKFGFGEKISDIIEQLAKTYGFKWGFRGYNGGAPYLMSINVPVRYYASKDFTYSGDWVGSPPGHQFGIDDIAGVYAEATVSGSQAYVTFSGTGATLICPVTEYTGGDGQHLEVRVLRESTLVPVTQTLRLNLNHTSEKHFYDGIDPTVGYNPTVFPVATGLPYDQYRVVVESLLQTGESVMINAVLAYENDISVPKDVMTVLASGTDYESFPGNIAGVSFLSGVSDTRNDIIVVGKSKGLEVTATNFNEPRYYYAGRAIDVRSVFDPDADNFVGRFRSGMIVNNRVTSDERADHIATSTLLRLRESSKDISLTTQWNPVVELHDPIRAIDQADNLYNDSLWISALDMSIDNDKIGMRLSTSNVAPYGSYIVRPEITLSGVPVITNVDISNGGDIYLVRSSGSFTEGGYTGTYITVVPESVGLSAVTSGWVPGALADVPFTHAVYPDPASVKSFVNAYEIPEYGRCFGFTASGVQHFVGVLPQANSSIMLKLWGDSWQKRGLSKPARGTKIIIPFDPYTSEPGQDTYVTIKFDLLRRSKVKVQVVDAKYDLVVATLSGDPRAEHPTEQVWDVLDVGSYTYFWTGFDQYGVYNGRCPQYMYAYSQGEFKHYDRIDGVSPAGTYVSESTCGISNNRPSSWYGKFYIRFTIEHLVTGETLQFNTNVATDSIAQKFIYTKRGRPSWVDTGVRFETDRWSFYSGELKVYSDAHPAQIDIVGRTDVPASFPLRAHIFSDADNGGRGLAIKLHCMWNSVPTWHEDGDYDFYGYHYSVPRMLSCKLGAKYNLVAAKYIQTIDANRPQWYVRDASGSVEGSVVGENVRLPVNTTTLTPSYYMGWGSGGTIYYQIYFSPADDHGMVYTSHPATQNVQGIVSSEIFGWLVGVQMMVQDLSGRQRNLTEYFAWVGQDPVSGEYYGDSIAGMTEPISSIPGLYVLSRFNLSPRDASQYAEQVLKRSGWWCDDSNDRQHDVGCMVAQVMAVN